MLYLLYSLIGPLTEFSELPSASLLLLLLCVNYTSVSVLHAVDPFATVLAAIGVRVGAFAVLFVELVVAFVLATVLPYVGTKSVHNSILEGALEVAAVGPLEAPVATHFVVRPNTCVFAPVSPKVDAFTLFNTILEKAMVVAAITPHFDAFAVLLLHDGHFRL